MKVSNKEIACSICKDIKTYNTVVDEVKRIVVYLTKLISDYSVEQKDLKEWIIHNSYRCSILWLEHIRPNFSCGYCSRADLNKLKCAENELRDILIKIFYIIDTNTSIKQKLYNETKVMIKDYYPGICFALDKLYNQKKTSQIK